MGEKVQILVSTFNGSEFVVDQLESVASQTLRSSWISIRDDGSSDNTLSVVSRWAEEHAECVVRAGTRLGVVQSFFALLLESEPDYLYFAFSDQDDVWQPRKLEIAVATLKGCNQDVPLLYCSGLEIVDRNLRHLGFTSRSNRPAFANALVENIATGCTIVLNRPARDLICQQLPAKALMHDWWCYLVVSAFGNVIYDPRPTVQYRQHSRNTVGTSVSEWSLLKRRFKRFLSHEANKSIVSDQAVEFSRCYGHLLNDGQKRTLERFLELRDDVWARIAYNGVMDVWRQRRFDTLILRALILMGRV